MPIVRRGREQLAADGRVDRERLAATTDEEIDRQIAADPDTAAEQVDLDRALLRGEAWRRRPVDVGRLRATLGMSQEEFAAMFGFSVWTVRNWEQGRRGPDGPAQTLLQVIAREPDAVRRALAD